MSDIFDQDDWGDDLYGGDINFDSDFDGKKQGFLSSITSGFLGGLKDNTFGSTEGRLKMARMGLPKSWGRLFDYGSEFNRKKHEVVEELKSSSFTAIKELQDLGNNLADRFENKLPNRITERLNSFGSTDFSSWEKKDYSSSGMAEATMQQTTDEEVSELTLAALSAQTNATVNLGKLLSRSMTEVGGRQLGAMNVGNQLSVSMDTTLKGLLSYQRKVQVKNDAAKIDLLSRIYLTNAKYYKFMEAAMHRSISELKAINVNSGMSDYQKTSNFQSLKGNLRDRVITKMTNFGGMSAWAKGLLGDTKDGINQFGDIVANANMAMQMTDGLPVNYAQEAGSLAAKLLVDNIPRLIGTKNGQAFVNKLCSAFPKEAKGLRALYKKLDRIGLTAGFGVANAAGIVNQGLADNWNYQEDYTTYEEYVAKLPPGKKPVPKWVFNTYMAGKNFAGNKLNDVAYQMNSVSGMQYDLATRNLGDLGKNAIWTNQSDRTLNEVIPEWFSKIHLSLEKLRTGNDELQPERYDYKSGRIISRKATVAKVNNTLFNNGQLDWLAQYSKSMASSIDTDGQLSDSASQALAMELTKVSDRKEVFNPFKLLDLKGTEGVSDADAEAIAKLIKRKFRLRDEEITRAQDDPLALFKGLQSKKGQNLMNDVSEGVKRMTTYAPDISNQIDQLRQAGMDDILRELDVIRTENGRDRFNMEKYWGAYRERLAGKGPTPLADDYENPAGKTDVRFGGNNNPPTPNDNRVDNTAELTDLSETLKTLTGTLNVNSKGTDYSESFGNISTKLDTANGFLEALVGLGKTQITTLENLKLKVVRGKPSEEETTEETREDKERDRRRLTILNHLKGLGGEVGGLLKSGLDKVLTNEPLMMGGFLGGLGALISHDPKIAIMAGVGGAAWMWYKNASALADADEANDNQDIYSEDSSAPLLEARKLKAGEYFDNFSKMIIKSWRDIKGSVTDIVTKVTVSAQTLAGKLFGPDGRRVIIKGLNKAKDFLVDTFRKVDPFGKLKKLTGGAANMLFQLDVYKMGEETPVLTRNGFKSKSYFKLKDGNYIPLNGWNEIDGPVYDAEGNMIVTQMDYENGLVTSAGLKINSMKTGLGKLGKNLMERMGVLKSKINPAWDKAKNIVTADYTPITDRLDLIYGLMCQQAGFDPKTPLSANSATVDAKGKLRSVSSIAADQVADEELGNNSTSTTTPEHKIRVNSLEDKVRRKREETREKFEESIVDIAESVRGNRGEENKDKPKKKDGEEESKGIFSKITDFMKNPFGIVSGFKTIFDIAKTFFTVGISVLPFIGKGVMKTVSLLSMLVRGAGRGADLLTGGAGRRRRGGRPPRGRGAGLKKIGKGLGYAAVAGLGLDMAMDYFDVDEDSTTGKVMDAAGTALNVVGTAQLAAGAAGMMGFNATLGGAVSAVGTGAAYAAPLIFNPVTLTAAAVIGGGYLIYRYYSKGKGAQYRMRLAQYGIKDADSDLAMKVRKIEDELKEYVLIRNGQAALATSTPLDKIFAGIKPDESDPEAVTGFYTWFNMRFKPVYLVYCSGLDTAGFKSFEDFDKSTEPRILSICSNVNGAMSGISPYPYSVTPNFEPGVSLIGVDETKRIVLECINEIKTYNKRHDRNEDGLVEDGLVKIRTTKENEEESNKVTWFQKAKMKLSGEYESSDDLREINSKYPVQKTVADINISDLLPGGDKPLDFITALRLSAYGNDSNIPWRVEAVLKMERYCEDYIQLIGEDVRFTTKTGVLFNLFKNTFRLDEADSNKWLIWFRDRFLPVCMAWVKFVLLNRKVKPKDGWRSLSATSRFNFGKELLALKYINKDEAKSIWEVRYSPFGKMTLSCELDDRAKAFLQNLQTMASEAALKDPMGEAAKTSPAELIKRDQVRSMGQNGVNNTVAGSNAPNDMLAPSLQAASMTPMQGNTDTSKVDLSGVKAWGAEPYKGGDLTPSNDRGISVPKNAAIQLIMKLMMAQGFTDKRLIAGMLANSDYESGGFRNTAENMRYSPDNLMRVFPKRVGNMANAQALSAQGPQAIANFLYGNRLGNTGPNDGWLYRGRGFIQLTGKENYSNFARDSGIDVINHPELVSNDPMVAAKSAVWFLKTHKRLQSLPQNGFEYATAAINPALEGIGGRRALYNQYLTQISNGQLKVDDTPIEDSDAAKAMGAASTPPPEGGVVPSGPPPESTSVGGSSSATPAVAESPAGSSGPNVPLTRPTATPSAPASETPAPAPVAKPAAKEAKAPAPSAPANQPDPVAAATMQMIQNFNSTQEQLLQYLKSQNKTDSRISTK